jgi:hypothetical protein
VDILEHVGLPVRGDVEVERLEGLGWVDTLGVLRCAQDDSKNKQGQG